MSDQFAAALDAQLAVFGEIGTHAGGELVGIFDSRHALADLEGSTAAVLVSTFTVRSTEVLAAGTAITIRSTAYAVQRAEEDGGGASIMLLRKT